MNALKYVQINYFANTFPIEGHSTSFEGFQEFWNFEKPRFPKTFEDFQEFKGIFTIFFSKYFGELWNFSGIIEILNFLHLWGVI